MYLSKVHVPWSYAMNPYELHRALWRLFPRRPHDERDFLYRVERLQTGVGADVLLQSQQKPVAVADGPRLLAERAYSLTFKNGQRLRFHLRANPVKTVKDESKGQKTRKGKTYTKTVRVPLIKEEQRLAWLAKKFEGIAVTDSVIMQPEIPLYFRKSKEQRSGKIQTVCFDGLLTVQDAQVFVDLIKNGIGPAKSFGCGLLSIAIT